LALRDRTQPQIARAFYGMFNRSSTDFHIDHLKSQSEKYFSLYGNIFQFQIRRLAGVSGRGAPQGDD
jgi:hypothetical protein